MTPTARPARRGPVAVLCSVVLVAATACGSDGASEAESEDQPSSPTSSQPSTPDDGAASDGAEEGAGTTDDLLTGTPQTLVDDESGTTVRWRFPADYETSDDGEASREADGVAYDLLVGVRPGTDPATETAEFVDGFFDDVSVETATTELGGVPVTVVTAETGDLTSRGFFFSLDTGATIAALFYAEAALADLPPDRLDEVDQMVASFDVA